MAQDPISYAEIPQFTSNGPYNVDVGWSHLEDTLQGFEEGSGGLDLDPDFQRAHVWTEQQQRRYVAYALRGGRSGRDIFFNDAYWSSRRNNPTAPRGMVLVDGKQRLQAVRRWLRNEIPADFGPGLERFNRYAEGFQGQPNTIRVRFTFHVNDLPTREAVLQWYVDLNSAGVAHTDEEIARVRELLRIEQERSKA